MKAKLIYSIIFSLPLALSLTGCEFESQGCFHRGNSFQDPSTGEVYSFSDPGPGLTEDCGLVLVSDLRYQAESNGGGVDFPDDPIDFRALSAEDQDEFLADFCADENNQDLDVCLDDF